jgi:hypothetical protein
MSRMIARKWWAAWALVVLLGTGITADEPPAPAEAPAIPNDRAAQPLPSPDLPQPATDGPEAIRQDQPSFLVRAEVNHPSRSYREGQALELKVASEEDAYLYVLYQQADGKTYQIFPNSTQRDNRVKARQAVQVPASGDLFRWRVGPPFGTEIIKVIASKEPLDSPPPAKGASPFTPIDAGQIKGIEVEIGDEEPAAWAECQIEVYTYARTETQDPAARRVGLFVGVSKHWLNQTVGGINDLSVCHIDARNLDAVLREQGGLDESLILNNEMARRANIEAAITDWLPGVTRPGDTVFIMFSGHAGPIPDTNGDEADGQDEAFVPHDYISPNVYYTLRDAEAQGQLPDELRSTYDDLRQLFANFASEEEAVLWCLHNTMVSDDVLGHWLQRLDGRKIVVILDACHSGGFAVHEKSLAPAAGERFDFLDREVSRLKDLGQRETVLISACSVNETAMEKLEGDGGVLVWHLAEAIRHSRGGLTVTDTFKLADEAIAAYWQSDVVQQADAASRADGGQGVIPHHPQLIDYSTRPIYFKP